MFYSNGISIFGKFNKVISMTTFEEEFEQQFAGFAKTAVSLCPFSTSEGNDNPNLAVNPEKLSPSTLSTQFLTLTWKKKLHVTGTLILKK